MVAVTQQIEALTAIRTSCDPSATSGEPAHVTVLYPFVPLARVDDELTDRLRSIASGVSPFDVVFDRVAAFADETFYLAPADPTPFLLLTERFSRAYPSYPPYGGRFNDVVPHLTVAQGEPTDALRSALRTLEGRLPIHVRVETLDLAVSGDGLPWRRLAALPLNGGVAPG